jgi:hypothetical protein
MGSIKKIPVKNKEERGVKQFNTLFSLRGREGPPILHVTLLATF